VIAFHSSRVGKAPVDTPGRTREDRANFSNLVTHGDDSIEFPINYIERTFSRIAKKEVLP
jgi:hypothetical protein